MSDNTESEIPLKETVVQAGGSSLEPRIIAVTVAIPASEGSESVFLAYYAKFTVNLPGAFCGEGRTDYVYMHGKVDGLEQRVKVEANKNAVKDEEFINAFHAVAEAYIHAMAPALSVNILEKLSNQL